MCVHGNCYQCRRQLCNKGVSSEIARRNEIAARNKKQEEARRQQNAKEWREIGDRASRVMDKLAERFFPVTSKDSK